MFKKGSMGDPSIYTAMRLNSVMDKTTGNARASMDLQKEEIIPRNFQRINTESPTKNA